MTKTSSQFNFTEYLTRFDKVWVWSDQHFKHRKIIEYCDRPFSSVEEMDLALEANWIETVGTDDLIISCGDFAFGDTENANEIIARCPGTKYLIIGNHDFKKKNVLRELNFDFMSYREEFIYEDNSFILTHHPIPINQLGTAFSVHGHIHNGFYMENEKISPYHACVSVEHTEYKPKLLTTICDELLSKIKIVADFV